MKRINPNKCNFEFSMVPFWLMARSCKEISQQAKLCYGAMCKFAGNDGKCFPSYEALSQSLGIGKRQSIRYINELERKLLIEKFERKVEVKNGMKQISNGYFFLKHKWIKEYVDSMKLNNNGVTHKSPPQCHISHPPSDICVTPPVTYVSPLYKGVKHNIKHNIKHICAKSTKKDKTNAQKKPKEFSCDFETAWSFYPKRSGSNSKKSAYGCWKARLKEGDSPEELIDAVKRYQSWCVSENSIGTPYVMQAKRFFGTSREYKNTWEVKHVSKAKTSGQMYSEWAERDREEIAEEIARIDSVCEDESDIHA